MTAPEDTIEGLKCQPHATQAGGGGGIVRVPEREVRIRLTSSST